MRKVSALQLPALVVAALLMAALLSVSVAAVIGGGAAPSLPSGTEGTPPYPSGSYGGLVTPGTPTIRVPPSPGCSQVRAPVCGNGIQEEGPLPGPEDDEQCDNAESTSGGFKVCADGTTAAIQCISCNFIQNPCGGCYKDTDCVDGNPCTLDTCVDNKCQQEPAPPDHVKAYSQTGQVLETCSNPTKTCSRGQTLCGSSCCNPGQSCAQGVCVDKCGNDAVDPSETCASCSADVKCGSNQFCTVSGVCETKICTPGETKKGGCTGQCETATQQVCNSLGTVWVTQSVTDKSCAPKCDTVTVVPCGNGKIDSGETCSSCAADVKCGSGEFCNAGACQPIPPPTPTCSPYMCAVQGGTCVGNSCIIQQPPPSSCGNSQCDWFENCAGCPSDCGSCPVVDPCANPDVSKSCCEGKGFVWAKSGEGSLFGGLGWEGCVGDDAGEYLRFRECEAGVCSTDAGDVAACASPYSCVYEGKCYARLDKTAEESATVQQKIGESRGREDKLSKLLQKLEELNNKAKASASAKEKKDTSKEIGGVMKDIDRAGGGIGEQSQGVVSVPKPSGATSVLLCTPPGK